jgi:predicted transcriptional regulator/transcriptional regulator with XRE-family HTH domain
MRAPIGYRVSSRRKALGISQAALARMAGISPSYLNLIEANKREVGGSLLRRIAEPLDIEVGALTGESEHRLIHELEEAFADPVLAGEALGGAEARKLVATEPAVAQALSRLYRAYGAAIASADAYANRLQADPMLSALLHQVLSGITAVRSSAEILADVPDLADPERDRFLGAITREAMGLSAVAQNLIGQFDHASETGRSALPRRELDDLIFNADNYFAGLEAAGERVRMLVSAAGPFGEATLAGVLEARFGVRVERGRSGRMTEAIAKPHGYDAERGVLWFENTTTLATRQFQMAQLLAALAEPEALEPYLSAEGLTTPTARRLARQALGGYLAGTVVFPYERFLADAEALRYDIDALRERYNASYEQVAHRLVTLRRAGARGVPFGFLRSDPAGRLTKQFPLPGLLLPSSGHACPLWAIYAAFRTPDVTVRQVVRFSSGSRYLFVARTVQRRAAGFVDQTIPSAIMLACDVLHADRTIYGAGLDVSDRDADVPVGPACRLCTRIECPSRQEEALAPGGL